MMQSQVLTSTQGGTGGIEGGVLAELESKTLCAHSTLLSFCSSVHFAGVESEAFFVHTWFLFVCIRASSLSVLCVCT